MENGGAVSNSSIEGETFHHVSMFFHAKMERPKKSAQEFGMPRLF